MATVIITAIMQGKVWVVQNDNDMPATWDSFESAEEWFANSPNPIVTAADVVTVVDVETGETEQL